MTLQSTDCKETHTRQKRKETKESLKEKQQLNVVKMILHKTDSKENWTDWTLYEPEELRDLTTETSQEFLGVYSRKVYNRDWERKENKTMKLKSRTVM